MVTGRIGALGKTKRKGACSFSMGTIGSKSCASAPKPCSQTTQPTGDSPVSTLMHSRFILVGAAQAR